MNITVQTCGLAVLALLLFFLQSHRALGLYREKIFRIIIYTITLSLILDVLSLVAIELLGVLPQPFVEFVCKLYLDMLMWGVWAALLYVLCDALPELVHRRVLRDLAIANVVASIIFFALPIYIYDAEVVYTYGPSTLFVYACAVVYITSITVCAIVYRKRINKRRFAAIGVWMTIWCCAMALQFFNQGLLVVGFASALGVLILFVVMENPEANIDKRLGCFNAYALSEYLAALFEKDEPFSVLELSLESRNIIEGKVVPVASYYPSVLKIALKHHDVRVFKNVNLSLVLVSSSEETLRTVAQEILETFRDDELFMSYTGFVLTSQGQAFSTMMDLFNFLFYVRSGASGTRAGLIEADEEALARYREKYLVEQEIAAALREDRVEVFFQPIYSNGHASFTSAEALVRIRRNDGSLMPPGAFIPVAEENGQIVQLGDRVFEKVCAFLHEHDAAQLGLHYVEVNLSVVQCGQPTLASQLIATAQRYGVDPARINLEITETASVSSRMVLLRNMEALIDYGFTFSLDDFGKGESNLMYVVEMPVSIVKLDYDITKAFFSTDKACQVVRAVVGMAHGMGLQLVSEGVETADEAAAMRAEGIDYIQGYFYSKPLPAADFVSFLRSNNAA